MNGFIRKKVGSLTLGEKLQKMRNEKRLSLGEISRATKIQVKYLEYLENNDYDKLPASVYVKGFLRSYAAYLGVNENSLIKSFEREKGIRKSIKEGSGNKDEKIVPVKISNFVVTPRIITATAVTLLVLGSFFYLYNELDSFVSTPRLAIISPADGSSIEGSQIHLRGITDKDSDIFINEQPAIVDSEGEFGENITLQEGLNTIIVKAVNRFEKESVQSISINSNYQKSQNDTEKIELNEDGQTNSSGDGIGIEEYHGTGLELEISALEESIWISVEVDGSLVYSGTMLSQVSQKFKADEKITVTSGKGNKTMVSVNGREAEVLSGDPGIVREVTFIRDVEL